MKKALILICLLSISDGIAQEKIALTLKDGRVLNGFGKIKINDKIVFRKNKGDKKIIYDYKTVKQIIMTVDGLEKKYEYKIVEGTTGSSVMLLGFELKGSINLYSKTQQHTMFTGRGINGGFEFSHAVVITTYYISKKGEDIVTGLRDGNIHSKKFKKIADRYFGDCPDVMSKINSKYFKRYEIEAVVSYYNENCSR